MSVYVLLHTVVPRLLRAKVDRHNWMPTTSYYLWPPSLPGYSLLYINYDLQSLIEAFNCVVLVLNTFGENRARLRRVASQSHHVPQQNKFSTQNNFSQNDFSQNSFSTQNTFLTDDWHKLWLRTYNLFFFVSRRSPRTCTSQKGFSTQKCRERVLLRNIEILRLLDLIYPTGKPSQDVFAHNWHFTLC